MKLHFQKLTYRLDGEKGQDMKNKTYVAIIDQGVTRFVTKVDGIGRAAYWMDGKKAVPLSKAAAENLYFGLRCNGYKACIVTMPDYEEPVNPSMHREG